MARESNKSLSEWLGIDDFDFEFAFETECSEILADFEEEQAIAKAQLATMSAATGVIAPGTFDTSKAERW